MLGSPLGGHGVGFPPPTVVVAISAGVVTGGAAVSVVTAADGVVWVLGTPPVHSGTTSRDVQTWPLKTAVSGQVCDQQKLN